MVIKFFKESDGRWYADLMNKYGISKEECEMVSGADSMLNIISEGEAEITLSITPDSLSDPTLVNVGETADGGCDYIFLNWNGISFRRPVWLCVVTQLAFGRHPNNFKIQKVENI